MSEERASLAAAVERLEAVTAQLGAERVDADELKRLAEEALDASAAVSELLPRVIREIERAAEGAGPAPRPQGEM
jgi:ABC-type transporter Mla subunit MlaD